MRTLKKLYVTGPYKDQIVFHRQCLYQKEGRYYSDRYGYYRLLEVR